MNETASIRRSVLNAVGWATGTRLIGQLVNWAMTMWTFRLLKPEDYGLMALTTTFSGFLLSLSYVGLADAVVQKRQITSDQLRSVFGLILLMNAACLAALCALAYPIAWIYDDPRLVGMLQLSSLMFVSIAFQAIPRANLEKRLNLKSVSRIELISNVSGGALVLGLAWTGLGVWSLLLGMLFTSFARLAGFAYAAPFFTLPRFNIFQISDLLHNGMLRTGENLLWHLYGGADVFIIGKLLGPHILGIYTVARYLANLPVEKLAVVIKPILTPAFAQVQDERAEALRYLEKALRLLGFVCFPVFLGMAATAPQITSVILGPRWRDAASPLMILALAMSLRPAGMIIPSFLMGMGEFIASFKNTLFATVLFPIAFAAGCYWGMTGVCVSWLVAYPVQLFALLRRVAIVCDTPLVGIVRPLVSPFLGSTIMYAGVYTFASVLPSGMAQTNALVWLVTTGALIYLGYALLFLRPLCNELLSLRHR